MTEIGYQNFTEVEQSIINYIIGYYSSVRPHQHNNGKSQIRSKEYAGRPINLWPNLVDHYMEGFLMWYMEWLPLFLIKLYTLFSINILEIAQSFENLVIFCLVSKAVEKRKIVLH
jgi:hypothetical protein